MPELIDSVAAGFAFQGDECIQERRASSVVEFPEDFECLSIPSRGIVVAFLISGILWAGIILGVRALWLILH